MLVQAVRLLWAVAVPPGPLGDWRHGGARLLASADARTLFASFDPFFRNAAPATGGTAVTALDLTLYGISLNEAAGTGSAIIAGADGVQASYGVGDEVAPGVRLAAVAFDHVTLDRGGMRESLFIDQSDGSTGAAAGGSPAAASAPTGGEMSPQTLQSGVSFAPRSESGRVTGLTVQPQGDGAVFRAAGLQPGDVIRAINGRPVATAADIATQIAPGARLSLEVERGSSIVPVALFIGKP